jgi:hypothetical protein
MLDRDATGGVVPFMVINARVDVDVPPSSAAKAEGDDP